MYYRRVTTIEYLFRDKIKHSNATGFYLYCDATTSKWEHCVRSNNEIITLYFSVVFRLISELLQLNSQLTAFLNLWQIVTGGTGVNTLGTPLLLIYRGTYKVSVKALGIAVLALFKDVSRLGAACISILHTL